MSYRLYLARNRELDNYEQGYQDALSSRINAYDYDNCRKYKQGYEAGEAAKEENELFNN